MCTWQYVLSLVVMATVFRIAFSLDLRQRSPVPTRERRFLFSTHDNNINMCRPFCPLVCPQGFVKSSKGCNLCQCANLSTYIAATVSPQLSTVNGGIFLSNPCNPAARHCRLQCSSGYLHGSNGCQHCICETTSATTRKTTTATTSEITSKTAKETTSASTSATTRAPTSKTTSKTTSKPKRSTTRNPTSKTTSETTSITTSEATSATTSAPTSKTTSATTRAPTSKTTSETTSESTSKTTTALISTTTTAAPSTTGRRVLTTKARTSLARFTRPRRTTVTMTTTLKSTPTRVTTRVSTRVTTPVPTRVTTRVSTVPDGSFNDPCIPSQKTCDKPCGGNYVKGPGWCQYCLCAKKTIQDLQTTTISTDTLPGKFATVPHYLDLSPTSEACIMAKVICNQKCEHGFITDTDDCLNCSCRKQDDDLCIAEIDAYIPVYDAPNSLMLPNPCVKRRKNCGIVCLNGYVIGPRDCEFCSCRK